MPQHTVVFGPPVKITADMAARLSGFHSAMDLVTAIIENRDGQFDRLYVKSDEATSEAHRAEPA